MNNSVKRVEPNPFGRIGLVAMSKKEHNSIGRYNKNEDDNSTS